MNDGGGRVYAIASDSLDVQMAAHPSNANMWVTVGEKPSTLINKDGIAHWNGEQAIVRITNKDQKGVFEIMDANGNKMVESGSLMSGKGYVLASPSGSSVDPRGNPSVLMGGSGRERP